MRIATFNLQNLRLRRPEGVPRLDPARDGDAPGEVGPERAEADRRLTAQVLARANADAVALQEVFDAQALDFFHDRFLAAHGGPRYPFRVCRPGNDGRGLNVALMARHAADHVESHAAETGASLGLTDLPGSLAAGPLFRRDCLEVGLGPVVFFVCHFKAPYPDEEVARTVRLAEARGVRALVERRFPDPEGACWIVLGDFNEPGEGAAPALAPLAEGFAVDLARTGDGWTFETPDDHARSRPDRIYVSPRLAREFPQARARVIRAGTGNVPAAGPHASDHALVYADFPGLWTESGGAHT